MNFEEVQSIWDSQQPFSSSIDTDALTSWIKSKNQSFTRVVGITEIVMTGTLLFVAGMFLRDPILQGHDRILIVAGVVSLMAAGFVWTGRIARKKRELSYDESLLGILDRSIDAMGYQIKRMRSFIWWFTAPMSLGLIIGLFIVDDSKRYLFYTIFIPGFVICMGLTHWQSEREIRGVLLPEKARLEGLRQRIGHEVNHPTTL